MFQELYRYFNCPYLYNCAPSLSECFDHALPPPPIQGVGGPCPTEDDKPPPEGGRCGSRPDFEGMAIGYVRPGFETVTAIGTVTGIQPETGTRASYRTAGWGVGVGVVDSCRTSFIFLTPQ